jgi:hypothetical protein
MNNPNKTVMTDRLAVQQLIKVFEQHEAFSEDKAISISAFKKVALPSEALVRILMAYASHDIVRITGDEKLFLNQHEWNAKSKRWKLLRLIMQILIFGILIPVIIIVLLYVLF